MKGETLTVEARCHQRKQDRTRSNERYDLDAVFMSAAYEQRARVRHGRTSRLRDEPGIRARQNRSEQLLDPGGRRVHIQLADLDFLYRTLGAHALQKRARRFRVFADE